jgi:hypothetical protein
VLKGEVIVTVAGQEEVFEPGDASTPPRLIAHDLGKLASACSKRTPRPELP